MFRQFYSAKRSERQGLWISIRRALSGLFHSDDHATKLESALRNAMRSTREAALAAVSPRYIVAPTSGRCLRPGN